MIVRPKKSSIGELPFGIMVSLVCSCLGGKLFRIFQSIPRYYDFEVYKNGEVEELLIWGTGIHYSKPCNKIRTGLDGLCGSHVAPKKL